MWKNYYKYQNKRLLQMLNGYKTYLAAVAAVLIALGYAIQNWLDTGNIEIQAVVSALIALALIFLRQGIKEKDVK